MSKDLFSVNQRVRLIRPFYACNMNLKGTVTESRKYLQCEDGDMYLAYSIAWDDGNHDGLAMEHQIEPIFPAWSASRVPAESEAA